MRQVILTCLLVITSSCEPEPKYVQQYKCVQRANRTVQVCDGSGLGGCGIGLLLGGPFGCAVGAMVGSQVDKRCHEEVQNYCAEYGYVNVPNPKYVEPTKP